MKAPPKVWGPLEVMGPRSPGVIDSLTRDFRVRMSLSEKIAQMSGDKPLLTGAAELAFAYNIEPLPAGENERMGIPGIRFTDGPRGVVLASSTCFPVAMARGATWDTELEERVGDAMGVEARSQGANFFAGVCVNLLRHPAWGRAQETYGEDPILLGEMGAALVRGVQRHVMACVKHFAANSIEDSRFKVDVRMTERVLRELYLPHFKRVVDEGAAAVMTAYNKLNGEFCGHNKHLVRDILKEEWGFEGFVVSDFIYGIRDMEAAIRGGVDVEMPFTRFYGKKLLKSVKRGAIPEPLIDDAVHRILRGKLRFSWVGEAGRYGIQGVVTKAHRKLAREAARKSIVLLENKTSPRTGSPVLPLDPSGIRKLAVIGRLAVAENTGDRGSSKVRPPRVTTLLEGVISAVDDEVEVTYNTGKDIDSALALANKSDSVILCVGNTCKEEGENIPFRAGGGDRSSLRLDWRDEHVVKSVASSNPDTVVILFGGGPIITRFWRDLPGAILMAWYPGMEGGHALADIIFGIESPSGRLPCSFPADEDQLPFFDSKAESIEYDLFHGYRLADKRGDVPEFPFGYGLGYTSFEYGDLSLDTPTVNKDGEVRGAIDITNTGDRSGVEVVQVYAEYGASPVERPLKELKAFYRMELEPGETRRVEISIPAGDLARYDEASGGWIVDSGDYRILAGGSSAPGSLSGARFNIGD